MEWVAQAIAERIYQERKHTYQLNFANALSVLKKRIDPLDGQRHALEWIIATAHRDSGLGGTHKAGSILSSDKE